MNASAEDKVSVRLRTAGLKEGKRGAVVSVAKNRARALVAARAAEPAELAEPVKPSRAKTGDKTQGQQLV